MDSKIEKKINIVSDQENKIIIEKDKQYIIDKNLHFFTQDGNKIYIKGVNSESNKLICLDNDDKEILLDVDEILFNEFQIREIVPYIFDGDTKIFFNQRKQKLIKSNEIVTVIGYAGEGLMLCLNEDGSEIKCKPDLEFVNFKEFSEVIKKIESGFIEIAPLAFMRGRTLSNAFIILDESQNTTAVQMKMFLTRLGENSKMVINGDLSQVDLPSGTKSGLRESINILKNVKEIGFLEFSDNDVVRNSLVSKIVKYYEKFEKDKGVGKEYV